MSDKRHLSISALSMLWKCGQQYAFRYIEGLRRPPGVALLVGKGVDRAVNKNLESKIATGKLLSTREVVDLARDATREEFDDAGEVVFDKEEKARGVEAVRGEAVDKSVRLAGCHAKDLAPSLNPVAVQSKFTLEMDGFPFDLLGYIDVDEPTTIRDTKTSGKTPAFDAAATSDQLTLYALARQTIKGVAPESVHLDTIVDLKTPKVSVLSSKRDDDDFRVILNRIENAAEIIESQRFTPARQDDWWCHQKWCGYTDICPYFRRSARPEK